MSGVLQYSVWSLPAFFTLALALVLLLWMTAGHRSREVQLMRAIVAVVALWATAHFARTLFTGLEAKLLTTSLMLPATLVVTQFYALFALEFTGRWRGNLNRAMGYITVPSLLLAAAIALPGTREWIYSDAMTVTRDGVVGLAIDITPLGRGLAILPFVFALGGMLAFGLEAVRSHARRTTAVLYLLLGVVVLPTHSLLRSMWLDGVTPVNLTPLGLSGSMLVLASIALNSRDRLRDLSTEIILDHLPHPLVLADGDGRVVTANASASEAFDVPATALESLRIRDLIGFDPAGEGELVTDRSIWHGEAARRYDVTQSTIPRPNGSVLVRALVLEDRTAYREARDGLHALTDELLQQAAELEGVNAAKRSFIAGCSDSLGEPLVNILEEADRLRTSIAGRPGLEDAESFVKEIAQGARNLHELVEDIRVFEATGRETALDAHEVDAHMLVEGVTTQLAPLASAKQLDLRNETAPDIGSLVADAQKLRQVLVNLASNAIKFTPDAGTVRIAATRTEAGVTFSVQDTGIGIPAADLERIFTPFEQIDSSLSRRHGGTGLGLALVRRLAELHGGSVDVRSEEGHGSTFEVHIPVPLPVMPSETEAAEG